MFRSSGPFVYNGAVFWSRRGADAIGQFWLQMRLNGVVVYDGIDLNDRFDFTGTPQFFASPYTGLVDTVVIAQFGGGGGGNPANANGADWDHLAMDDFQFTPDGAQDTTPPVVTAPANISVETSNAGGVPATNSAIAAFLAGATATDDVDGPIATVTNNAPATFPVGVTTVTFSATDSSGNTGTAQATVTVTLIAPPPDTTPPVVTAPASITVQTTNAGGVPATDSAIAAFLAGATATDDVDGTITTITNNAPATFPVGVTTVTFSATDSSGNTGTAQSTVTVTFTDTTAPVVTAPANITVQATDPNGVPASNGAIAAFLAGATATDDVDGAITTITNNAPATFPVGVTTVTFSATDSSGNTGTAQATVTVTFTDTTAPVVTAPANITVVATEPNGVPASNGAIAAFLAGATATDDVDGTITTITNNAPATFPVGVTTVTFSATDSSGNTGTAQATVTVTFTDTTAPVVTAPASITVVSTDPAGAPASDSAIAAFLAGATATDDVDGTITTITNNAPATFPQGVTTVTFSATDSSGNTGTAQATVTVTFTDTTAPVVTAPANISVPTNNVDGVSATDTAIAAFLAGATATDDVDGTITTITNNAPATFPVGVTTVTFSATDTAGNTGTAQATVTVTFTDNTAPVVTAPANITVPTNNAGGVSATDTAIVAFLAGATATDDADGTITTITNDAPATFPAGDTIVTFNATDSAGNTGTAQATVTVNFTDNTAPVVTAPGNISVETTDAAGVPATSSTIASFLSAATATDDADGTITTITNDAPATFPAGVTTVTFSATDSSGNTGTATATVTVTVVPNVQPLVILSVTQGGTPTLNVDPTQGGVLVTSTVDDPNDTHTYDWSLTDNALVDVDGVDSTFTFNPASVTEGVYTLTLIVTDQGGLSTQVSQYVRVVTFTTLTGNDTDGDGIPDNDPTEGHGDSDGDGIENYLDDNGQLANELPVGGGLLLKTETGLSLKLGSVAFAANSASAAITTADLDAFANLGPNASTADTGFDHISPIVDFIISGLSSPGSSASVVIDLGAALPANAQYRKFFTDLGWVQFVANPTTGEAIASAASTAVGCPDASVDASWAAGLIQGDDCVRLTLVDGGQYDTDGLENGSIADPGVIATATPPPPTTSSGGGGGGQLSIDLLIAMFLLLLVQIRTKQIALRKTQR